MQDRAHVVHLWRDGNEQDDLTASTTANTKNVVTQLQNVVPDEKPILIRREDGFEKRTCLRCDRCGSTIGYQLDASHFPAQSSLADQIVFILPGGLLSTTEMLAQSRKAED